MTHEQMVREFMEKNHQAYEKEPTAEIPDHVKVLRLRLIAEEFGELAAAIHTRDLELIADALADLEYVVVGTAVAYGIPHEKVFCEVHRSNMTKPALDQHNKGGKVVKDGYSPANIRDILRQPLLPGVLP